jgi:hypothetical protein
MSPHPSPDLSIYSIIFRVLPRQWLRERVHGPAQVMLALMLGAGLKIRSYRSVLEEMFDRMGQGLGWTRVPSASGFAQARRRLPSVECIAAFKVVLNQCASRAPASTLAFAHHRLVAVDGTKVLLPVAKELCAHFGCPGGGNGTSLAPQASLTILWEIGANRPLDWRMEPNRHSERAALLGMLDNIAPDDVVLVDRGLISRSLIMQLLGKQAHLLARAKVGRGGLSEVAKFLAGSSDDVTMPLEGRETQRIDGDHRPRIRLLRLILPDGQPAVFVTTLLNQERYPAKDLLALYTARWRIETAIRELKLLQGLEHLRATYPDGIRQEVCALMLFALLESEIELNALARHPDSTEPAVMPIAPPAPHADSNSATAPVRVMRHPYRFCRRIVADFVIYLMVAAIEDPARIPSVFERALDSLWRYRQRVRPNRSFPRVAKSPASRWGHSWGSDSAGRAR